ncbi:MAG: hypothetical protein IPM57_12420 [Oligoflexia bacterium]|nr:hypothetical protein [Oligoflexia bacterium]
MSILLNRGNTFEASTVPGILKLIIKKSMSASFDRTPEIENLYRNLEMYAPFSFSHRNIVLDKLLALTPEEIKHIRVEDIVNLVERGWKLADISQLQKLINLLNKPFRDEALRAIAKIILKFDKTHIKSIELLLNAAKKNNSLAVRATNDLLTTSEKNWAENRILEFAKDAQLSSHIARLLVHEEYNSIPSVEMVEAIIKNLGGNIAAIKLLLFYLEDKFPETHTAYTQNPCGSLLKDIQKL